mmetsp:Transcript_20121/g.41456  ORF Transcript_20121/g.41456 Transcript_20121/m.41456 type:complete len:499 (-) Transcript_20121:512-2008(-)
MDAQKLPLPCASKVSTAAAATTTIAASSSVAATAVTTVASTATVSAVVLLTEITASEAFAATATASATTASATRGGHLVQPRRNNLIVLFKHVTKLADDTGVLFVDERKRATSVSGTTGTSNSVNVVVNVGWEIVVDHIGDIGNIQTTTCDIGSCHNGGNSALETAQGIFTFTLRLVSVNGASRESVLAQDVFEVVAVTLCLRKDQNQTIFNRQEKLHQGVELIAIFDELDRLSDILGCRTDTANGQKDVIAKEITGQSLDLGRESRTKHHSLTFLTLRHSRFFNNATNLWFETHIKHSIGFVQHQELDVFHAQATTLDQIHQSSRGCHQQITTTFDLTELFSDFGTTVNADGSDTGAVGETTSFFVNLLSKFAGWGHDQGLRVYLATSVIRRITSTAAKHGHDDGEEETGSFTTTGLGTGHQITTGDSNRTRILLDRSGSGVTTELGTLVEFLSDGLNRIGVDGIGSILSGNFNGDFVVVVKVDSGGLVLTSVELTF